MTIYCVRHTEYLNPDNIFAYHLPLELSEKGRAHAKRIAEWFKKNDVTGIPIFSSPVVRTRETAEIIAQEIGSSIANDIRLVETRCPNLQGKKMPETGADDMESNDPSREPIVEVQKRVVQIFNEKVFENKDCIFISHGDPLTSLYYYLVGKPLVPYLYNKEYASTSIHRGEIIQVEVSNPFVVDRFTV